MEAEAAYLAELVSRLRGVLGDELVGVYAGGSYALCDYDRARSDLDVAAVTRSRTNHRQASAVVAAVRHEALPCPARGLELVLYGRETAGGGGVEPGFDLNLNTGRGLRFRADSEPLEGQGHWFAIDRSVLAAHGIALFGPPAATVFRSAPREKLVPVLAEELRWYVRTGFFGVDAVLNARRALRFAREGSWYSKTAGGAWARESSPDPQAARAFLESSIAELEAR